MNKTLIFFVIILFAIGWSACDDEEMVDDNPCSCPVNQYWQDVAYCVTPDSCGCNPDLVLYGQGCSPLEPGDYYGQASGVCRCLQHLVMRPSNFDSLDNIKGGAMMNMTGGGTFVVLERQYLDDGGQQFQIPLALGQPCGTDINQTRMSAVEPGNYLLCTQHHPDTIRCSFEFKYPIDRAGLDCHVEFVRFN